jgi:hypothetical protein
MFPPGLSSLSSGLERFPCSSGLRERGSNLANSIKQFHGDGFQPPVMLNLNSGQRRFGLIRSSLVQIVAG